MLVSKSVVRVWNTQCFTISQQFLNAFGWNARLAQDHILLPHAKRYRPFLVVARVVPANAPFRHHNYSRGRVITNHVSLMVLGWSLARRSADAKQRRKWRDFFAGAETRLPLRGLKMAGRSVFGLS